MNSHLARVMLLHSSAQVVVIVLLLLFNPNIAQVHDLQRRISRLVRLKRGEIATVAIVWTGMI